MLLPVLSVVFLATGCGGATSSLTGTPEVTARAFVTSWEAGDSAQLNALLTSTARDVWALGGGPSKWLTDKAAFGKPVAGTGHVVRVTPTGKTATALITVTYDCTACRNPGQAAYLTLEQGTDGTWLVSDEKDTTVAALTQQAGASGMQVSQAATETAIPTATTYPTVPPTPAPVFLTAKAAYAQLGIAAELRKWSADAILFRVFDRVDQTYFSYDANGDGRGEAPQVYTHGDGTSRQWLFFAAAPSKQEIRLLRVLDGRIARQDGSAAFYRDLFAGSQLTPQALNLDTYVDSDQAVKIARAHGYTTANVAWIFVQLGGEDRKLQFQTHQYKATRPTWTIFGAGNKAVIIDAQTGAVLTNDF